MYQRCTLWPDHAGASVGDVLYRGGILLSLLIALPACQFRPEGGAAGDDDDGAGDSDAVTGDDAAAADAPVIMIDGPSAPIDAPIDARPPCPADYTTVYSGVRYVRRGPAGIDAARNDCGDDLLGRTRLATFPVPGTIDGVLDELLDSQEQPWLGAKCEFGTFGCAGASSWSWDTGEAIDVTMWAQLEPNNAFTELNAAATRRNGGWELVSVDGIFPFEGRRYVCSCAESSLPSMTRP